MEAYTTGILNDLSFFQVFIMQNAANVPCEELKCTRCRLKFTSGKGLRIHVTKMHDISPKTFVCFGCFKSYRSDIELKQHRKKVHFNTTKIACVKCEKFFGSKSTFTSHNKKFHPVLPSIQ